MFSQRQQFSVQFWTGSTTEHDLCKNTTVSRLSLYLSCTTSTAESAAAANARFVNHNAVADYAKTCSSIMLRNCQDLYLGGTPHQLLSPVTDHSDALRHLRGMTSAYGLSPTPAKFLKLSKGSSGSLFRTGSLLRKVRRVMT